LGRLKEIIRILENRGIEFVETSPRGVILEGEFEGMNYSQVYGSKK